MDKIIFIGGARDYHAMDWYRTVKSICKTKGIIFVTDSIDGESFDRLINENDDIIELFNIDRFLFRKQSKYGNIWRNIVKLLVLPIQILCLKSIARKYPSSVFHAIPMYYMFLCMLARIPFIGTPQGSEILVRPYKSKLYRYFARKCLLAAKYITVDSVNMSNKILELSGKKAEIIQNGIDVDAILPMAIKNSIREHVVSLRGFTSLYRINEILDARERSNLKPKLHFIYPFIEESYKKKVEKKLKESDADLGRLSKDQMYKLLISSKLALSIPVSDSSPRSVYEAIFCGCCVAVTYNPWIEAISECMKTRLFIVDLDDKFWFDKALEYAEKIAKIPYIPSESALNIFDQRKAMKIAIDKFY